jgi:bilin biosynthesis protein
VHLIEKEANMSTKELFDAIQLDDVAKVHELLDQGADINTRNHLDQTVLMRAVICGAYESTKVLIEKGARVGARQISNRSTALHDVAAESRGTAKMAELLIEAGADVNAETSGGYTPLIVAAGRGKTDIVQVLLDAGANADMRGESGKTALQLAEERGYHDTAELIKNYKGNMEEKRNQPAQKLTADLSGSMPKQEFVSSSNLKEVPNPGVGKIQTAREAESVSLASEEQAKDLVGQLFSKDTRGSAARKLLQMRADAVEPLIAALQHRDLDVRRAAARILGQIGDQRAINPLVDIALGMDSKLLRADADQALLTIGEPAMASIIKGLERPGVQTLSEAADLLGRMGNPQAVAPLAAALHSAPSYERGYIVKALGQIGGEQAAEALAEALQYQEVRPAAARWLEALGDVAVAPLIAVLGNKDVRNAAVRVLVKIGAPAMEPLTAVLENSDPAVCKAADGALRKIAANTDLEHSPLRAATAPMKQVNVSVLETELSKSSARPKSTLEPTLDGPGVAHKPTETYLRNPLHFDKTICGICAKNLPAQKHYKVYTGIIRISTIKTGFKEYQEKSQTIGLKEHQYDICESCNKKYNSIYPWLIWSPAILFALFAIVNALSKRGESGNTDVCFCAIVPLAIAYYLTSRTISAEKKLVKKAVSEREKTNWQSEIAYLPDLHRGYSTAKKANGIKGYTQEEYERLMKSQQ